MHHSGNFEAVKLVSDVIVTLSPVNGDPITWEPVMFPL
jgi:hypothetical protein